MRVRTNERSCGASSATRRNVLQNEGVRTDGCSIPDDDSAQNGCARTDFDVVADRGAGSTRYSVPNCYILPENHAFAEFRVGMHNETEAMEDHQATADVHIHRQFEPENHLGKKAMPRGGSQGQWVASAEPGPAKLRGAEENETESYSWCVWISRPVLKDELADAGSLYFR